MRTLNAIFNQLPDGAMAAVRDLGSRRHFYRFRHHRYWELAGCTTRGASKSQYDHGAGWWRNFAFHPNCTDEKERRRRSKYYYDHGVNIMYWKRHYGGQVTNIPHQLVARGHCTSINKKNYQWAQPNGQRNQPAEIDRNFNIKEVAASLGIAHLL